MKRKRTTRRPLAYTLYVDGRPTGYGALMTEREAKRTNETLKGGQQWRREAETRTEKDMEKAA